jgi:DNA-binding HxlR family transcriptional regulator
MGRIMELTASGHLDNTICPVARTARIISGKWTLLIIRDLTSGVKRFNQLERSLSGISPKTLSERLRSLEEEGIIVRQTFAEVPPRVEYTLTEKGHDLVDVIESMRSYGKQWLCGEGEM